MNLTLNNGPVLQNKAKTKFMASSRNSHPLSKPELSPSLFPFSVSDLKNNIEERPLKTNSQNLSFKGLFYKPVMEASKKAAKIYNANEILSIAKENNLGKSVEDLFNSVKNSEHTKKMFSLDETTKQVTFQKKTILNLIIDGIIYPIKTLPLEILNGGIQFLKKIKPFKKWAEKAYDSPMLKNMRQKLKSESKVNALRGVFETIDELKDKPKDEIASKLFQKSVKMFDAKTGNYDTKHERSLCRIVSGYIPAVFLANDAYNLSIMYKNDKKEADKEKQARFKQELSRVTLNAYVTLITLGALQKYINNSSLGIMLNTAVTVLFTESFARLTNGKHITRLTPEQAKAENAKNGIVVKDQPKVEKETKTNNDKKDKKAPLLSFGTVLKASLAVIATGYGVKALRSITIKGGSENAANTIGKYIDNKLSPITQGYKKLTQQKHEIDLETFNKVIKTLEDNGFDGIAKKYKEIANDGHIKDGKVILGTKDKKTKPFVDFVIAPFKFIFNTIKLPYSLTEKAIKTVGNKPKDNTKPLKQLDLEALSKSIDKMITQVESKNFNKEKFQSYLNDNILKSFNVDNVSNISNSELANLAKTSATAATIWFLMTDNYNMVMLKSNGENKNEAEQKFKERFVQEGSRLFYQTLLIDLFNSTFRSQYNSSLWGMTWVTAINTTISEILNRKSIGMPVKAHSKEELQGLDAQKANAKGALRSYYDFMARLTGKKTITEIHEEKIKKEYATKQK